MFPAGGHRYLFSTKAMSYSTGTSATIRRSSATLLVDFEVGTPVLFEATYSWAWLADLPQDTGFDAQLAHPATQSDRLGPG